MLSEERLRDTRSNTAWSDREEKPFQEYAEKFMDDLFADVEQLLSLNAVILVQPKASSAKASAKVGDKGNEPKLSSGKLEWLMPGLDLPGNNPTNHAPEFRGSYPIGKESVKTVDAQIMPISSLISSPANSNGSSSLTLTKLDLPTLVVPEMLPDLEIWVPPVQLIAPEISVDTAPAHWFERLLWLILGLSLGVATLAWLYNAKVIEINSIADIAKTPDPASLANLPSAELKDIQNFAQKTRHNLANLNIKQTVTLPNPPAPNILALSPSVNSTPNLNAPLANQIASQSPFVLPVQPIYVPVYQPPTSLPKALVPPASVVVPPRLATPNLPPSTAIPALPSPIARVNPESAVAAVTQTQKPAIAAKPILPLATMNSQSKFKLVGILAFGEQSAAMVEVGGAFQTIKLGNPIGDGGWVLSGLNQQEAILKRNGETRSITVGQKF